MWSTRISARLVTGVLFLVLSSLVVLHFLAQPSYSDYLLAPLYSGRQGGKVNTNLAESLGLLPLEYKTFYQNRQLPRELLAHPELYTRLHAFLSRPVFSHEEGLEWNEKQCPRDVSDRLVNPDQLEGNGGFWRNEVTPDVIRQKRVDIVNYLSESIKGDEVVVWDSNVTGKQNHVKKSPVHTPHLVDRGIVTTGGNADTTARLITLLRFLRHEYHMDIPVEVWAFPGEMQKDSTQWNEIVALGGTIHEIPEWYHLVKEEGAWKNFQIKGLAIALSHFKELIYLDSDNVPLRDPTYLFDTPSYTQQGSGKAVFWPDLSKDHVDNAIWRLMGQPCTLDDFTLESGQIVIDKAGNNGLNMAALRIAAYMQAQKDFWFEMCGGDKDTFRWAFAVLDIPFTRATRWASCLGQMNGNRFCGHTVLQYELDAPAGLQEPRPLFVHSNLLKHIINVRQGQTFTHLVSRPCLFSLLCL